MFTRWIALTICALLSACASAPGGGARQQIATETFMLTGADPGVRLHVRNKRPAGVDTFAADRVLLFVHGATYPCTTGFDIELPGGSWMDYVAARGYDAYCLDVRGYGGSSRPASMSQPPETNPAFADTTEAVRDVTTAVDFILKRRAVAKLSLVGWSWGTSLVGSYTVQNNAKVDKLVLYAPVWTPKAPRQIVGAGSNYRTVDRDSARGRGLRGIPKGREEEISPTEWFDRWWAANLGTDPEGAKRSPPVLRAPNGVLKDIVELWSKGNPTWDPAEVRVPTLLIVAEWDQDTPTYMAQEVFAKMTNAPYRRLEMLSDGTHAISLEKNRMHLIEQVQSFLDKSRR